MKGIFCILFLTTSVIAYAQSKSTIKTMDLNIITNETVRGAIQALQNKDSNKWLSYFTSDAKMTDDGSPRDFQSFSKNAIGNEWFTELHHVKNDGKDIYGHLTTKQWGAFNVYFKFHVNNDGKIYQLDIGQAR